MQGGRSHIHAALIRAACLARAVLPWNVGGVALRTSNKNHAQSSLPVIELPGIHLTRPIVTIVTIVTQWRRYGAACLVNIQPASISNHVGRCADSAPIIACNSGRDHGGLVMYRAAPAHLWEVASARPTVGLRGTVSKAPVQIWPAASRWRTRSPAPAQGSQKSDAGGKCGNSGTTAAAGVSYASCARRGKDDRLPTPHHHQKQRRQSRHSGALAEAALARSAAARVGK